MLGLAFGADCFSHGKYNVQVYIPQALDPNTPVPLLLVHHGLTMNGEAMRTITGFQEIADREGFAVAFPDGLANPFVSTWNAGTRLCGGADLASGKEDDLMFVKDMIASIEADQCLSREHVFMTCFSMGGFFSSHAACQLGDLVRGIAPSASGTYPGTCARGPLPVMLWHGTADGTVRSTCSPEARNIWVERNGCKATFDTVAIKGGKCEWQHGCPEGAQVVLCMVDGMNHQWSGGASPPIGAPNSENESEMIWKFFKDQSGL